MAGRNEIEILLKAIDAATPVLQKIVSEVEKTGGATQQAGQAGEQFGAQTEAGAEAASRAMNQASDAAGRLASDMNAAGLAAGAAFAGLVVEVNKAIEAYTGLQTATMALDSVAASFGQDQRAVQEALQEVTADGLVPVGDAAKALSNLLASGFNLPEAIRLFNALKDSAALNRQGFLSMGEAIVGASIGIKNGNSILVDNAGITKNLSLMLEEAGYSAQDLMRASEDAGIRQVILNGILQESARFAGGASKMVETLAGKQAQAGKAAQELQAAIGGALEPSLEGLYETLVPLVKELEALVNANPALVAGAISSAGAFLGLGTAVIGLTRLAQILKGVLAATKVELWGLALSSKGIIGVIAGISLAIGASVALANKRRREMDELKKQQQEVQQSMADAARASHAAQQAAIGDTIKKERELARVREQAAKQEERRIVSQVDRLYSQLTQALRKRYDEQEKTQTKSLDRQIDSLRDHYKREVEALEEATRRKKTAIQAQIDEIDRLMEAQDQANEEADRQKREAGAKEELFTAGVDPERAKAIMDDLADIQEERTREAERRRLEAKKDGLQAELDEIDRQTDEKKRRLEEENRAQEEALRQQREQVQQHYAELKDTVDRQAMELLSKLKAGVTGAYEEIVRILQAYEQPFEVAGLSAGELWLRGFQAPDIPATVNKVITEANNAGELIKKAADEAEKEWRATQEALKKGIKGLGDDLDGLMNKINQVKQAAASLPFGRTATPNFGTMTVPGAVFGKDVWTPTSLNIHGGVNIKIDDPRPDRLSKEVECQLKREAGLLGGKQFK